MNKKQKIGIVVTLPVFLLVGLLLLTPPNEGFAGLYTGWFALGVIYAGLFFILMPSRHE